jgi:hypothetical protein
VVIQPSEIDILNFQLIDNEVEREKRMKSDEEFPALDQRIEAQYPECPQGDSSSDAHFRSEQEIGRSDPNG